MRTQPHAPLLRIDAASVPLLDASYLPGDEDWAVLESIQAAGFGDDDDDRYAGLGVAAGDFD